MVHKVEAIHANANNQPKYEEDHAEELKRDMVVE